MWLLFTFVVMLRKVKRVPHTKWAKLRHVWARPIGPWHERCKWRFCNSKL